MDCKQIYKLEEDDCIGIEINNHLYVTIKRCDVGYVVDTWTMDGQNITTSPIWDEDIEAYEDLEVTGNDEM